MFPIAPWIDKYVYLFSMTTKILTNLNLILQHDKIHSTDSDNML